jgi:hypothetical protein
MEPVPLSDARNANTNKLLAGQANRGTDCHHLGPTVMYDEDVTYLSPLMAAG